MRAGREAALFISSLLSLSCSVTPPAGVEPVEHFELPRYLGKWYEIARLDHSFERGLTHVTADYSLRTDGGVRVINRGFSPAKQRWRQSEGKAYFLGPTQQASLKVSFFGPFYGGYHVIELDSAYRFALVAGPNRDYLWLLSRDKTLPDETRRLMLDKAQLLGFPIDRLVWVDQK